MKRMMTGLLAACIALGAVAGGHNAVAGPPTKSKPAVKSGTASSSNPLGLSPAQKKKLEAINAQAMKDMMAIRNSGANQQDQARKMSDLQQRTMIRVNDVLTPAQRTKFQQLQAQTMQKVLAEQAKDAQLRKSLSPAQIQQLTKIQKAAQASAMKVLNDKKLTQQQKDAKLKAIEQSYLAQKAKIAKSGKK